MSRDKNLLKVEELKVSFLSGGSVFYAVNGVSFSIAEGETFGLVGESGCGKSTTSKAIVNLLSEKARIDGGSMLYKGEHLEGMNREEIGKIRGKEIGMIFQEPMTALNPVLTIKEQMYEQFIGKKMTKEEKKKRAIELLNLVGISSPEKRLGEYIHQYSGGMRQRAMIAIVLAGNPSLLIADEPTTALDVTIQDQILKLINSLKKKLGMSILLITHDLGVISQMCDKVAVMYAGYIVEMADTVTLYSAPGHPYTEGLIQAIPNIKDKKKRLNPIPGFPPDLAGMPKGCPFAPRCRYCGEKCTEAVPPLTDMGNQHYTRCFNKERLKENINKERMPH